MCGIIGHIKKEGIVNQETFHKMVKSLEHRGPDGEGVFVSTDGKRALGHRRLSFLDLSNSGKQPMSNSEATTWVSFNGEIYNYLELKEELKGEYQFVTESDTEVILAAYQKWGVDFVTRLNGMFAIALLDENVNKLYLIRDRFGIKPLYYGVKENEVVFASELKAVLASKSFPRDLNKSAVADYFVYRYIPSPKTIWEGISKVPPANYITIDLKDLSHKVVCYWELSASNTKVELDVLVKETENILKKSVDQHERADVPIGSFLSGGYDSSALALWMNEGGKQPTTFSIGFQNWEKSEHYYAKTVADYLGLKNKAVVATADSLKLLKRMPEVYDEPIADISIVPTFMVSALARKEVKAVFSGEGADEIFGGYTWQHDFFNRTYNKSWLQKVKNIFKSNNLVDFYAQSMAMGWFDSEELKQLLHPNLHASIPKDVHWFYRSNFRKDLSPFKAIQHMDLKCFMGELVLTKIDRASMANSLEVRVPFLDHRLFEKIFSVEETNYIDQNQTKKVLFEMLKRKLPKEILERKKQGFVGPDSYYMNIDFYRKELGNCNLVRSNIVQKEYIDKLLKESYNWKLWKILIFEKWFTHWLVNIEN
jgi:asparagine synthase (glutamine-hydrolysing)